MWAAFGRHHSELADVSGDRFGGDTTPQAAPVLTYEIRAVDLAFLHGLGQERTVMQISADWRESRLKKFPSPCNELQRRTHQAHPSLDRRSFPLPLGIVA